jgi:hypothetical protein
MEIKCHNGTVFIIESDFNYITIEKKDAKGVEVLTKTGTKLTLIDDNIIYVV